MNAGHGCKLSASEISEIGGDGIPIERLQGQYQARPVNRLVWPKNKQAY